MFFLHQLLRLFDDTKMPCFTFIITCSHHFRRKSLNYILIIIKLRGQSPRFEELSPSCFYSEHSPIRFRQSVIAPLRHLTNATETPLQSSRGCEEVSLSPPCHRRVRFAKSDSSRMNCSGYAIVALPALSLLHGFRTWVAVCRCQGTKALPN